MTDRTRDLSELAPLARVISRTLADTPIRLGGPDTTPTLVAALTVAVAVYIGRDVLPPGALDQARPLVTTWTVEVQRASGDWCQSSAPHDSRSEAMADLARVQASGRCRYRLTRATTIHTIEETACGLRHDTYPESACVQPAGHNGPHAAPLIIDGRECGAAAWGPDTTTERPAQ